MKKLILFFLLLSFLQVSFGQCKVLCTVPPTDGRLCPGSLMWKNRVEATGLTEADLIEMGYHKDPDSKCYVLSNTQIQHTGSKHRMRSLYQRLLAFFGASAVRKEGF